jgi:hypothetical protein
MNPDLEPMLTTHTDVEPMEKIHVEDDSEIRMACAQLYRAAKNSLELHRMIKYVDQLEGWVQAKITLAAENLENVKNYMEYELVSSTLTESQQVMREDLDPKTAKLVALGRKMMDYSAAYRPTKGDDEMLDLMNKFSAVGEKLTSLGTLFGPRSLTASEKDIARRATQIMKEPQPVDEANVEEDMLSRFRNQDREQQKNTLKRDWMQILMRHGMGRDQAGQIADKMTEFGISPGRELWENQQGVPANSKLLDEVGEHKLYGQRVIYDEHNVIHEYVVINQQGVLVENLDMPHSSVKAARARFRSIYN